MVEPLNTLINPLVNTPAEDRLYIIKVNRVNCGRVFTNSNTSYTIKYFSALNEAETDGIHIPTTTIDLTTNGLNGLAFSGIPLLGTINPSSESTNLVGTNTTFTLDFAMNDSITCGSQTRTITAISSNTLMYIDSPFTLLNKWVTNGTATSSTNRFVYGTKSLYSSTTFNDYVTFQLGAAIVFNPTISWTLEFHVNLTDVSKNHSICYSTQSNSFLLSTNRTNLLISLGNGSTYNIAAASALTGQTIAINTWYHVAITYSGTRYVVYINGVARLTVANATNISANTFNNFRFGGDSVSLTGMGYYDLVRLSSTIRYTTNFTPPTQPAALDASTIVLDDFENTTITNSDTTTTKQYSYFRGGVAKKRIYYCYALNHNSTPGYIVSTRTLQNLVDIPVGYSLTDIKQVPMFFLSMPDGSFSTMVKANTVFRIYPVLPIVESSNTTTLTTHDLTNMIPNNVQLITIMVTHIHNGTILSTVNIGMNDFTLLNVLPLNTTIINSITLIIPLDTDLTFCSQLSTISGTTTYSIDLLGFYYS